MSKNKDELSGLSPNHQKMISHLFFAHMMMFEAIKQVGGSNLDFEKIKKVGEEMKEGWVSEVTPTWFLETAIDNTLVCLGADVEDLRESYTENVAKVIRSNSSKKL